MKFSVTDNESVSRRRRTQSARSPKSVVLNNDGRDRQGRSALIRPRTPGHVTMPTTAYRKSVSETKERVDLLGVTPVGDVNGSRVRLISESSNASTRTRTLSEPKPNILPSVTRSRPPDDVHTKKPGVAGRKYSKDLRHRSESLSSDSTDGSRRSVSLCVQSSAWDAFDDHVKNINDSTDYYTKQQKVSFRSSDTFQKTMLDLYGKSDYGKSKGLSKFRAKLGTIASLTNRFSKACNNKMNVTNGDSELSEDQSDYETPSKRTIENAQRGWRILRRHVQDMVAQKKNSAASLNWSMLKQTMRGMSDMEKTRIDLYKRYGIIPTVNSDGTVIQENTMLSERARAHAQMIAASKGSALSASVPIRRVQSHRPPSWNPRNSYKSSINKDFYKQRRPKSSQNP
ncbi:uncharacterized protein LOC121375871 [Gigantopelta aegis]|uniref:uncharacterized protein LOC121375871 n=1 Tax=Gigantopelta aegis TaxID=1735272 RepID=UPI001B88DA06|nr:uncharacterized protein LOC121375871 [Gigantopelta aegis]